MIRREMYDVQLPSSTNKDGTLDLFGFNQGIIIELAVLLGEAIDHVSLSFHRFTVINENPSATMFRILPVAISSRWTRS